MIRGDSTTKSSVGAWRFPAASVQSPLQNASGNTWLEFHFDSEGGYGHRRESELIPFVFGYRRRRGTRHGFPFCAVPIKQSPRLRNPTLPLTGIVKPIDFDR